MNYKDYYKELGVEKTATTAAIKKAYRALANKYHPDKTNGDKTAEEKFKAVSEANQVLSDPAKRKKYDQFGADWKHYEESGAKPGGFDWSKYGGAAGGRPNARQEQETGPMGSGEDINDLFEMLFGQKGGQRRGRRSSARKGEDYGTEATISLEEAFTGTSRLIQLHGQTIKVTIKPGVEDEQMLRVPGKGAPGENGGPHGDLFLTIKIIPHPGFVRKSDNLYRNLPVDLYTAILGGKTEISTLSGIVKVFVPKGAQNGTELRLRGLGMPVYGKKGEFGNLLVKLEIQMPEHLSEPEFKLFEQLQALRKEKQ